MRVYLRSGKFRAKRGGFAINRPKEAGRTVAFFQLAIFWGVFVKKTPKGGQKGPKSSK